MVSKLGLLLGTVKINEGLNCHLGNMGFRNKILCYYNMS
jgi:hypothetical protein